MSFARLVLFLKTVVASETDRPSSGVPLIDRRTSPARKEEGGREGGRGEGGREGGREGRKDGEGKVRGGDNGRGEGRMTQGGRWGGGKGKRQGGGRRDYE